MCNKTSEHVGWMPMFPKRTERLTTVRVQYICMSLYCLKYILSIGKYTVLVAPSAVRWGATVRLYYYYTLARSDWLLIIVCPPRKTKNVHSCAEPFIAGLSDADICLRGWADGCLQRQVLMRPEYSVCPSGSGLLTPRWTVVLSVNELSCVRLAGCGSLVADTDCASPWIVCLQLSYVWIE